jgi:hypothetical protein
MKRFTVLVASLMVASLMVVGSAAGAGVRAFDQIRLRDGSCVAAAQLKTRDRLKDGSCLAQLTTRTRDRLKDGSCV